jgi:hypothetical protein
VGKAAPDGLRTGYGSLLGGKIPGKIALQPVWLFSPDPQAVDILSVGAANSLSERTGI